MDVRSERILKSIVGRLQKDDGSELEQLRKEVEELRKEVLRLRDLLEGR